MNHKYTYRVERRRKGGCLSNFERVSETSIRTMAEVTYNQLIEKQSDTHDIRLLEVVEVTDVIKGNR